MKRTTLVLLSLLSGCTTLERHPVATRIAGAVIVGSVALSLRHHGSDMEEKDKWIMSPGLQEPDCEAHPGLCN